MVKGVLLFMSWLSDWLLSQDQRKGGHVTLMVHTCAVAHFQTVSHNLFISLKTTPLCPAGSRAWKSLFGSVACGPREILIFLPSARVFDAPLTVLTAVAGTSSSCSQTLSLKSPSLKSWSNHVAICVISIQNITVNSISLNNIGGQWSSVSVWQGMRQQLIR